MPAHRIRQVVAGFVLVGLVGVFLLNTWHVHALETELQAKADAKVAEIRRHAANDALETGTNVTVSKSMLIYGDVTGKIEVYTRGEHTTDDRITGYEYFYRRAEDGTWQQTESGRCSSEECRIEGVKALASE